MYRNSAYLGEFSEDIVDNVKPILVTAAGHYRLETLPVLNTDRPDGRGDYQLIYVSSGKLHLYQGGEERIVAKGNMILFRPGQPQSYDIYLEDKPETYWVHFTGADIEKILERYDLSTNESVFFTGTSSDYQWLYEQIIRELRLRRINYGELVNMNLCHIFLMINRFIKEKHELGADALNEVERATHYFNENYNKTICIKDYAAERHMSECWFNRTFKQLTKTTPTQYVICQRINGAIQLLESTSLNVTQIAGMVGYEDALYFSRLFKKHTGIAPTEYRKQLRG